MPDADVVIGSRFAGRGDYAVRGPRRWAMRLLSRALTGIVGTAVTDPTSGFRLVHRRALALFAEHYPEEYLGDTVEALVIAHRAGLTITQVPVAMRVRACGRASTDPVRSAVYLLRVVVAVGLAMVRRAPALMPDLRLSIVSIIAAVAALVLVFELLRRRRLREKYAAIWIVIAVGTVIVAVFPQILQRVADLVGIQTPSNLLFFGSLIVLFAVSLQLSREVGLLEEQSRRLAEEVGTLTMRVDALEKPPDD